VPPHFALLYNMISEFLFKRVTFAFASAFQFLLVIYAHPGENRPTAI